MHSSASALLFAAILCTLAGTISSNRVIEWKRRLSTCDAGDHSFSAGDTTQFIYAYNNDHNVQSDSDLTYHGALRRGSKSVKLFSPPIDQQIAEWEKNKPADTYNWSLLVHNSNKPLPFDSNVTGPTTTYWCNAFALPNVNDLQFIIRNEAIVPSQLSPYMHHLLVYECPTVEQNLQWLNYEGHCYDSDGYNPIPAGLRQCNGASVVGAWAVGGQPYLFPPYLGMPYGGLNGTRYVLVESHWNNPSGASITIDQAGMRFYATRKEPTYQAGMLEFGHATNPAFTIPAQSSDFVSESWCPAKCTEFLLNSQNTGTLISPLGGIRLVANFLHAHTTGVKIQLHRVNADGVEDVIVEDNTYNFNFQTTNQLPKPIDVLPGETLRVHCHYNTMARTQPTPFGLSTQQEMCLTYTMYYPRLQNTKSACLFANYSLTAQPARGAQASCGNLMNSAEVLHVSGDADILPNISQPYAPQSCTYNPPPNRTTQGPKGTLSPVPFNADAFPYHIPLDANGNLLLHYEINNVTNVIHFALEYPITQGWMGLGYGANGGMTGSDINLGWIDDISGAVFLTDRMATQEAKPPADSNNDLYDIIAYNSTKSQAPNPPGTTPSPSPRPTASTSAALGHASGPASLAIFSLAAAFLLVLGDRGL